MSARVWSIAVVLLGATCVDPSHAETLWINGGATLYSVDSATPGTFLSGPLTYSGFSAGDAHIDAFDFHPTTGVLYGYTSNSGRLYTINTGTGGVTAVGTSSSTLNLFLGMTFESATSIRIVHASGAQFRIDPTTGSLLGTDTTTLEDGLEALAYDGVSATTYAIDSSTGNLYRIGSLGGAPNGPGTGITELVGATTIFSSRTHNMDVSPNTGIAYVDDGGGGGGGTANLYTLNLTTGAKTYIGPLAATFSGSGNGIAIEPDPVPEPATFVALATLILMATVHRRRSWLT